MVAFASVFLQVPGLFGPNGLEPVEKIAGRVATHDPSGQGYMYASRRFAFVSSEPTTRVRSNSLAPSTRSHCAGQLARPYLSRRNVDLFACDVWIPSLYAAAGLVLVSVFAHPRGRPNFSLVPMGHLLARSWRSGTAVRAVVLPIFKA